MHSPSWHIGPKRQVQDHSNIKSAQLGAVDGGGWTDPSKIKTNSTQVEVVVEVGVELGNIVVIFDIRLPQPKLLVLINKVLICYFGQCIVYFKFPLIKNNLTLLDLEISN